MRVLAIDPGNVTGVAYFDTSLGEPDSWEDEPFEVINYVEDLTATLDAVVCESFIPRPGAYSWQPEALYTIGAVRYVCRREGVTFVLQSPADAKRFSTNEKLKRLGWYSPTTGGHSNDALRHLLLFSVKNRLINTERLLSVSEGTI